MVSTTVMTTFKTGLLATMLAVSTVTLTPAAALAAANTTTNRSSQSKNYVAPETAPVATTTAADTTVSLNAASTASSKTNEATPSDNSAASAVKDSTPSNASQSSDPAGNNGTIKIDRAPFDSDPNNEPHVGCTFQVDFYGYDKGVGNANVSFDLQNPTKDGRTLTVTSGNLTPNIGEDAAGGGTDVDAQETYTLAFTGAPHAKQGYHVKVTVHAPGSQGADTKYKVFWVQPCEEGHILGEAATSTGGKGGELPSSLPSTGAGFGFVASTLAAMGAAYRYTYKRAGRKA